MAGFALWLRPPVKDDAPAPALAAPRALSARGPPLGRPTRPVFSLLRMTVRADLALAPPIEFGHPVWPAYPGQGVVLSGVPLHLRHFSCSCVQVTVASIRVLAVQVAFAWWFRALVLAGSDGVLGGLSVIRVTPGFAFRLALVPPRLTSIHLTSDHSRRALAF